MSFYDDVIKKFENLKKMAKCFSGLVKFFQVLAQNQGLNFVSVIVHACRGGLGDHNHVWYTPIPPMLWAGNLSKVLLIWEIFHKNASSRLNIGGISMQLGVDFSQKLTAIQRAIDQPDRMRGGKVVRHQKSFWP